MTGINKVMATKAASIKSFSHHCYPATKLLVFSLPPICPVCSQVVNAASVTSPVVQYSSPFVAASSVPFSVVIKPTVGDFLNSYGQGDNLHTGITTSRGSVWSYDERGICQETSSWSRCLAVPLLEEYDIDVKSDWNEQLAKTASDSQWLGERYADDGHNCFDFVVCFLNAIGYSQTDGPITRESFCRYHVMPVTSRAAGYIGIYRSIAKYGFLVENRTTNLCHD